jgi:hypothetical protein
MTDQPTDQDREAFEKWAKANKYSVERYPQASKPWPGRYIHLKTEQAWQAWLAALARQRENLTRWIALTEDSRNIGIMVTEMKAALTPSGKEER